MITDELEIRQKMRDARQRLISKADLTETEIAKMLHFANEDLLRAYMEINGYMIANPQTSFEYWTERLSIYKDAKLILDWLAPQPETIPEPQADIRYMLKNEYIKTIQKHQDYAGYKDQIEAHGSFGYKQGDDTIKLYTPTLCFILSMNELEVYNLDAQKDETINGMRYLDTYTEAYYKGIQHFEDEIKVNQNVLYANAESIVKDLHHKYFHAKNSASSIGWQFVKKSFPKLLNHKAIFEYGYFSGIVCKVDEMIIKYPNDFKTFDKCEIKEQEKGSQETEENNLSKLFSTSDWQKYFDALVHCTPPLLKFDDDKYKFIGNKKTQRGIVGSWIKYLKSKGIVNVSLSRDEIAKILTENILDYSITGSTIDNASTTYQNKFESQLIKYIQQ